MDNQAASVPQPKFDLSNAEDVICEGCENNTFLEVIIIKKVSAIMSPTGQEVMAPIKTFQCAKCSHMNDQFIPRIEG
jgi:hypothetical protein|tara:strand:- start:15 stop:245 length:231 start_codon:yes stop_codon:yes gene_type:complete